MAEVVPQCRPRILVVEDDRVSRLALAGLLRSRGLWVTGAGTLADGLARLPGHDPVLLDPMLPDGSGVELVRSVRRGRRPVRVAVCTTTEDGDVLLAVQRLRPDAYFPKPINLPRLFAWMEVVGVAV